MNSYFPQIGKIPFEGRESRNPLAFKHYDAERVVGQYEAVYARVLGS